MTNAEAIGMLAYIKAGRPEKEVEALDLAILALEGRNKPRGTWHHSGECTVCKKRSLRTTPTGDIIGIDFTDFCKNCGADMRPQEEEQHGPQ